MRRLKLEKRHLPVVILIVFGILLFFMGMANHWFFRTVTFDYGNYNFAFRDYAHFRISPMPTYPGNFLQDHYSFLLMFLVPVYWLLNWLTGTYTLITIQYAMVLWAAWSTWKLVSLKTSNLWLGAGVMLYYFLLLGRYTTFSCDVNLAVLSACLIPPFLYAFEKQKYPAAALLLVVALLSRENIPIWFIFIFIVLIINHRKEKKAVLLSAGGLLLSLFYFILLFAVLIPGVENEEKQFTLFNYSALGEGPGEALRFVVTHPLEAIKLFFVNHLGDPAYDGVKTEFYLVYLLSGGILLVLRPQYLLWFIPVVAQKVLNDSFVRWGISTYYSIEVVTLLPLSVFLVLASLKRRWVQNGVALLACAAALTITLYKLNPDNVEIPWTMNPAKERIYKKEFFQSPYHIREVNRIIGGIPRDAAVSTTDRLFSHLSQRDYIRLFPTVDKADYILFSVFDNYFMFSQQENEETRNRYLYSDEWELVAKEFPVFLLKRKGSPGPGLPPVPAGGEVSDTLSCNFESRDSLREEVLFDDGSVAEIMNRISAGHSRSGDHSVLLDSADPYSKAIPFPDAGKLEYVSVSVYCQGTDGQANLVATIGNQFYILNNKTGESDERGWKKLELSFWVPQHIDPSGLVVYVWNTGSDPLRIDDMTIIKRYHQ
jgi:hypothetical protein